MSIADTVKKTSLGLVGEFKAFVAKGNVVDLAVGVIIGAAFKSIVDSMVKDIITPIIGLIGGQPDFSAIAFGAHKVIKNGAVVLKDNGKPLLEGGVMIGNFINQVVSFLIVAAVVFFVFVKPMNKLLSSTKKEEAAAPPPPPPEDILLLREIRDSLKKEKA